MQTTDMQQIQLTSGWNKVYTVLTLEDTEFDLVSDARDNIVTSSGQLISTGSVGITSNVLRITDNMNNNDYYAIDYIQLEKGNRPTDYYPAPEDLTDYNGQNYWRYVRGTERKSFPMLSIMWLQIERISMT